MAAEVKHHKAPSPCGRLKRYALAPNCAQEHRFLSRVGVRANSM